MKNKKLQTTIALDQEIRDWIDSLPRNKSFSEVMRKLIRDQIDISRKGMISYRGIEQKLTCQCHEFTTQFEVISSSEDFIELGCPQCFTKIIYSRDGSIIPED
jgi:hypothetical protein